jgi:regulator of protease activity HflC (stomatin/prohibitin superfamily)
MKSSRKDLKKNFLRSGCSLQVERVEVKDVRVPEQLQRAMAAEAEAAREARAKVIAAEGEHKASRALRHAAEVIIGGSAAQPAGHTVPHKYNTLHFRLYCTDVHP